MTPTNKLRFVERTVVYTNTSGGTGSVGGLIAQTKVLQQWWEGIGDVIEKQGSYSKIVQGCIGQWCDVPLEKEE